MEKSLENIFLQVIYEQRTLLMGIDYFEENK